MINSLNHKFVVFKSPAAIADNTTIVTTPVDASGFDYLDIQVVLGALDIDSVTLKLRETDDGSTWNDIDGANFLTAKPTATSDNLVYAFHVNLVNGRKKIIDVVFTVGDGATGTFVTIVGQLSRGKINPSDAAGRGYAAELFV